jgi:hypothetical protein
MRDLKGITIGTEQKTIFIGFLFTIFDLQKIDLDLTHM